MLRNILTVALRSFSRQWTYSFINTAGLAIGIACSLVIFLFVYGEWSYDKTFSKADRIYRIGISFFNIGKFANGPERLLEILPQEFPGLETATRIQKDRNVLIERGGQTFQEAEVYFTDSAFFKVFDFPFVAGDASRVLRAPNEMVITESVARKFFGTTDALGEILNVGKEKTPYTVTGIVADRNFNTHLTSEIWLSIQSKLKNVPVWSSAAFYSYVLLREHLPAKDLDMALNKIFEKYVYPESGKPMGFKTLEDYRNNENAIKFYVHPLKEIYLKSKLNLEISPGGDESSIYIFSGIAMFILLLAAVNFVNLTTARASRRAREVGIRKTLGTTRSRLVGQFLLESVLTSMLAMVFALVLAEVFLLAFTYVTGHPLMDTIWQRPSTVLLFIGFSAIVGLLSGVYPALVLTSFLPVKVLKGDVQGAGGGFFRNGLVVFQFTVSIVLMVGAAVVQQQMDFMATKDLGFDQRNVVTIDNADKLGTAAESYRDELASRAGVKKASFHMGEPGSKRVLSFYTYQTPQMQSAVTISTYFGDENFIPLMGIRLLKGRNFSKDLASDTLGVIFNEAAVKALGFGENPIDARVNEKQKVIGVMSDFHWESLRTAIAPTAVVLTKDHYQLGLKLESGAIPGFLKVAEARWKELKPDEPFKYHFLDENFGELLQKEAVFGKAISLFTMLAIFISCLGLYGLSAYTAEQRTREIGIRKVLGASASEITLMLNRKFTILVLIAVLMGVPLAYYLVDLWLEGFAYRTDMGISVVLWSISSALLIAWLTVGYHSIKAARVNPAVTIKYE